MESERGVSKMNETEEKEETITLKKSDLWKYSTFILAAILVVGAFLYYTKSPSTNSTANVVSDNGSSATATLDDLKVFEDSSKYPALGPSNAKVTVIELSDFQCPFCALASGLPAFVQQYQAQYGDLIGSAGKIESLAEQDKLRFIYVSASLFGAESKYTTEAGLCANEQGKFWEMHDAIFTAHDGAENNGKYNIDKLEAIASGISGLDKTKFNTCLESSKYASTTSEINNNIESIPGFEGTPTFYVNGVQASGSWTQLSSLLKADGVSI